MSESRFSLSTTTADRPNEGKSNDYRKIKEAVRTAFDPGRAILEIRELRFLVINNNNYGYYTVIS